MGSVKTYGLTSIIENEDNNSVEIMHVGNMGNTIDHVRFNVDTIMGNGWFDKVSWLGEIVADSDGHKYDDPSYSYMMVLPRGTLIDCELWAADGN